MRNMKKDDENFMDIAQAAATWDVTPAWVASLCRAGRVQGAVRGPISVWRIPEKAPRPEQHKRGRRRVAK